MGFIRAILEAFDPEKHQADVRPKGHPASLLVRLPIAENCPAELLSPGKEVAVLTWPDVGGVVLAPYGGRPAIPPQGVCFESGQHSFTQTSYTAIPNLQVQITLNTTSRLWIATTTSLWTNTVRSLAAILRVFIDGALQNPPAYVGQPRAGCWQVVCLAFGTQGTFGPGTHTVDVRVRPYTAGDTLSTRYSYLSVWATPS